MLLNSIVVKFEFRDKILKQNDFSMYVKKGKKVKYEPKYFTRKVIEKAFSYGETRDYVVNVVPILSDNIKHLIDVNIFQDLVDSQVKLKQVMLKKSVYEYFEECKKELKVQHYYEYIYGDYDKYASKM